MWEWIPTEPIAKWPVYRYIFCGYPWTTDKYGDCFRCYNILLFILNNFFWRQFSVLKNCIIYSNTCSNSLWHSKKRAATENPLRYFHFCKTFDHPQWQAFDVAIPKTSLGNSVLSLMFSILLLAFSTSFNKAKLF